MMDDFINLFRKEPVDHAQRRLDAAKAELQRWQLSVRNMRKLLGEHDYTTVYTIHRFYAALDRVWACQCMMKGTRL